MKIVDVNEFYAEQGGGVRTYVNAKLEAAAARGHEVVVVAPGPRDEEISRLGGRVIWVKGPPMPLDPRYYVMHRQRAVHAIIEREAPDVIEGSSPWTAGWFAARYRGPAIKALIYHQDPVAVYPQTLFDRWFSAAAIDRACLPYWRYVNRLARHFDATVVAGRWLAERLTHFGIPRAVAVPFGIDRAQFSPTNADEGLRHELLQRCGQRPDAALFVSISRYHPEKRLTTLLRGFEQVRKRLPAGLVVFGDGPLAPWIKRVARGIDGVHLAGFVRDRPYIAKALASADGFVHGSAAETYGFVVAEAMCSGTPLVVPKQGGAYELAQPTFAEFYEPSDVQGCAAAMMRLLGRDRDQLGRAALEASQASVLTTDQHFEQLFATYSQLVQQGR